MMLCGLYTRVSTDLQALKKDSSLDTQEDILRKWVDVKDQTSTEDWKIVKVYREEGKSGKNTDRDEYQEMLQDISEGRVNCVICTKIDRISRSLMDFYHFHELVEEHQGTFISLSESWDTSTPMGRFALKITLAAAELEREQTSDRTKEKMQWRAEQGLSNGGQKLGYNLDPNNKGIPKVNEDEKALVLLIFNTYLKEEGFKSAARVINEKGCRTKAYVSRRGNVRGGKKFNDTTLARILTDEFYIGQITYNGETFESQHTPIVPLELWEKAQAKIKSNRILGAKKRKQNLHLFLLQGLVKCGNCGSYMSPHYSMNQQKKPYFYYSCTDYRHKGKDQGCGIKPVPAQPLEDLVVSQLLELKKDEDLVDEIVERATTESQNCLRNFEKAKESLLARKRDVDGKIESLVDGLAGRKVGIKAVSRKLLELEEQQSQLAAEIIEVEAKIRTFRRNLDETRDFGKSLVTFSDVFRRATGTHKKELIGMHLNQLIWTPEEIKLGFFPSLRGPKLGTEIQRIPRNGDPEGSRTPVSRVRVWCPRPLNDGVTYRNW